MFVTMSNFLNVEFVQALNPLYAFPIVAVILCAFIVYAFGFKSPVQPPCFDGIEEEKKVTKKRKTKESSKGKLVQNGKLNGNAANKAQVIIPVKKKESEKFPIDKFGGDKTSSDKQASEKKAAKKVKSQNEKKSAHEKKKENVTHEDAGEDGWVQLISKKGRRSRKKEEAVSEINSISSKPSKTSDVSKSDESSVAEESPVQVDEVLKENTVPEKLSVSKEVKDVIRNDAEVASSTESKEILDVVEERKPKSSNIENIPSKENSQKIGKLNEEASNKSKKKKKKNSELVNVNNESLDNLPGPSAVQIVSELSSTPSTAAINSTITAEIPTTNENSQAISAKVEVIQPKEAKSSNVVFDELAGLYPDAKEQRKKKKVRRDH